MSAPSCYACCPRCPVSCCAVSASVLRMCYAVSGNDLRHSARHCARCQEGGVKIPKTQTSFAEGEIRPPKKRNLRPICTRAADFHTVISAAIPAFRVELRREKLKPPPPSEMLLSCTEQFERPPKPLGKRG
eukprot:3937506-Rhodomonas_salina.1